jgi:LPPG:FO 2-phospho-L-lactate transferase
VRVVALAGGTGGAKLAAGLQTVLPHGDLTVVVNTGDDTERHGLLVMPDHDAVLYMLAGRFDYERGWGVIDESWTVMDALAAYGEDAWFRLGDRDFATHIARHARLTGGARLTTAVRGLQSATSVPSAILPMTDAPVRTQIRIDEGWIDFQEYFVHRHQVPEVREVRYAGIEAARPTGDVLEALPSADVIVIGPSNPIVSVGPILAVPGMRDALAEVRARGVSIVAVSPIIAGKALKGPADRMLASLGLESTALGVARGYADLLDVFVLDAVDAALVPSIEALGLRAVTADTVMADEDGRARVARSVLEAVGLGD